MPSFTFFASLEEALKNIPPKLNGNSAVKIILTTNDDSEGDNPTILRRIQLEVGSPSSQNASKNKDFFIVIGPEGGWTQEEIQIAKSFNYQTASLGDKVLRVETAAIIASAAVLLWAKSSSL